MRQIEKFFEKGERKNEFKRSFLINSLKRLEEQNNIFSKTDKDAIHGKLTKHYYFKFLKEHDSTEFKFTEEELKSFIKDTEEHTYVTNSIVTLPSLLNTFFGTS